MHPRRNPRRSQQGSMLIEISMSYGVLVIVALLMLKSSVNLTAGQAWTVKQTMTDAFVTRESALASRLPFEQLTDPTSPWPLYPAISSSKVTIGKLPGGSVVTGTVHRTRFADPNNLASAGGTGTPETNPAATEAWKLQSVVSYTVGSKKYVKSRVVLRIR